MKYAFATASVVALLMAGPALAQAPAAKPDAAAAPGTPDIIVKQPPAVITVQPGTPNVTVHQDKPNVKVEQAPPKVSVTAPKPEVAVETGKPAVNVLPGDKPEVTVVKPPAGGAAVVPAPGVGTTTPPATAAAPAMGAAAVTPMAADVKDMIGKDVYGPNGNQIGEINNLLVDPKGRIRAVVVEFGGFLGIGENKVAVPWDKLTVGKDRIATNLSQDVIKTMPRWAKDRPGDYADATPFR
jgi:sporulation protein YlmC with PRC-barrel domain